MSAKRCSMCHVYGHNRRRHQRPPHSRSADAAQLVGELGLSLTEAGRRIGVSKQAVHQWWQQHAAREAAKTVACGIHPLHNVTVCADGTRSGCPMCEMQIEELCCSREAA